MYVCMYVCICAHVKQISRIKEQHRSDAASQHKQQQQQQQQRRERSHAKALLELHTLLGVLYVRMLCVCVCVCECVCVCVCVCVVCDAVECSHVCDRWGLVLS